MFYNCNVNGEESIQNGGRQFTPDDRAQLINHKTVPETRLVTLQNLFRFHAPFVIDVSVEHDVIILNGEFGLSSS